ncbi:Cro/CI family transcriptional regulator [Candidatus Igneacidithiobacillus taiwanensis]|uniref:transcriptional regulator n=1 Tax=Candidatus Igneacidithiobacillus taiwanensis TaxID=1945924 RepID=UPI0028993CBE|nr:Cro/CI family transcriptional regulator [Candidatus Igneacidithiobacillus taiwanensis]
MNGLKKAITHCGSKAALARAVGVVPMTVSHWVQRGIPIDKAIAIERATNGAVTREELRPDIFLREGASHRSDPQPAEPTSSQRRSGAFTPCFGRGEMA